MSKYTKAEDLILNQLVLDCDRWKLTESESLFYIKLRFGKQVNRDTYFSRKRKLLSDPQIQKWYSDFAKVGYAIEHKTIMEGLKNTLGILQKEMFYESIKPRDKINFKTIVALSQQVNETTQNLRTVLLDSPFVAALKAELDRLKIVSGKTGPGDKYLKGLEDRTRPAGEPKTTAVEQTEQQSPSSLIIPIDSIVGKPQESTKEDRERDEPVF